MDVNLALKSVHEVDLLLPNIVDRRYEHEMSLGQSQSFGFAAKKKTYYMYSNDINSLLAYVCELNSFSL